MPFCYRSPFGSYVPTPPIYKPFHVLPRPTSKNWRESQRNVTPSSHYCSRSNLLTKSQIHYLWISIQVFFRILQALLSFRMRIELHREKHWLLGRVYLVGIVPRVEKPENNNITAHYSISRIKSNYKVCSVILFHLEPGIFCFLPMVLALLPWNLTPTMLKNTTTKL